MFFSFVFLFFFHTCSASIPGAVRFRDPFYLDCSGTLPIYGTGQFSAGAPQDTAKFRDLRAEAETNARVSGES